MDIQLPDAIGAYFAKDKLRDPDAIAACFTPDAVVKDEGHTYVGRDAIRRWKAQSSTRYTYTVEPFALEEQGGQTIVVSHLEGNFPGSPVDLRYAFRLEDGAVSHLEITL